MRSTPRIAIESYTQARPSGHPIHGVAICTVEGEAVEPVYVLRDESGVVQLIAGALRLREDLPAVDLHDFVGGTRFGMLSEADPCELEDAVRRRVADLDAVRITVFAYHAFPVPAKRLGGVIGGVQCALHGDLIEPLLVVRDRTGRIVVRRVDELPLAGGGVFDRRPTQCGIRLDDARITADVRAEIDDAVRHAVAAAKGPR